MLKACLQFPLLEYLDCSNNYEDMGQAQLIKKHNNLKTINMEENDLEDDQLEIVVKAIK
jgi:hypothetical protein